MKKSLFVLLAAAVLAGCTSTVSKNVRADGSVGELVWPSQKDRPDELANAGLAVAERQLAR